MRNNFKEIYRILELHNQDKDHFYFGQLIQRRKDGHEKHFVVKGLQFRDVSELKSMENKIIKLCNSLNARFYLYLTPRSWTKVHYLVTKELNEINYSGPLTRMCGILNSCCGHKDSRVEPKYFMIDVDTDDWNMIIDTYNIIPQDKFITTIHTVSGRHIITEPIDTLKFAQENKHPEEISLFKNNSTLVYYEY